MATIASTTSSAILFASEPLENELSDDERVPLVKYASSADPVGEEDDTNPAQPAADASSPLSPPLPSPPPSSDQHYYHEMPRGYSKLYVLGAVFICVAIVDLFAMLQLGPTTRLLESVFCKVYYREHDPAAVGPDGEVPEALCKVVDVQRELAVLKGWQNYFEALPGLLLMIPYGVFADKYGRKPVIVLAIIGLILDAAWVALVCYLSDFLPIAFVYFSSAFLVIGGGSGVVSSVLCTVIADIVTEDKRSSIFFQLFAVVVGVNMIAFPLSSILMALYGPWVPIFVGLGLGLFGLLLSFAIPETLPRQKKLPEAEGLIDGLDGADGRSEDGSTQRGNSRQKLYNYAILRRHVRRAIDHASPTLALLTSPKILAISMVSLVGAIARLAIWDTLIQYSSERLDWSLAKSNLLLSIGSAVNLGLLVIALPGINAYLSQRSNASALQRDLWVSRVSLILRSLGLLGVGVASTPPLMIAAIVIFALGQGYEPSLRSAVASLVAPDQVGRTYSAIGLMVMIGSLVAGPVLGQSLERGLALGGMWVGLPFYITAALTALVTVPMFFMRGDSKGLDQDRSAD